MNWIIAAILGSVTPSAHATVDSWSNIYLPVISMDESGYCMAKQLVWDGTSGPGSVQLIASQALNKPWRVPTQIDERNHRGLSLNINELYNSGVKTSINMSLTDETQFTVQIEVTKKLPKTASRQDRLDLNTKIKLAIYAAVYNTLDASVKSVPVVLKGLPDQTGLDNPIPTKFDYAFTSRESPYMSKIAKEADVRGICN